MCVCVLLDLSSAARQFAMTTCMSLFDTLQSLFKHGIFLCVCVFSLLPYAFGFDWLNFFPVASSSSLHVCLFHMQEQTIKHLLNF